MFGKRRAKSANAWDGTNALSELDSLTENKAAPVIRHSAFARKAQVRTIKLLLFVGVPLVMFAALASITAKPTPVVTGNNASSTQVNSSPGKAVAVAAVNAWLAAQSAPVPDGQVLSWDGYSNVAAPKLTKAQQNQGVSESFTVEIDHFTVESTQGNTSTLYDADVEVQIAGGVPTVVGTPTLLPLLTGVSSSTGGTGSASGGSAWPGYVNVNPSQSVTAAVNAWVTAFTSGSSATLRLETGDPNQSHGYLTLSEPSTANVSILSAGTTPAASGNQAQANPNTIIARVTFSLTWPSSTDKSASSSTGSQSFVTYDVLIQGAASGSPRVVAWGAPGTGPELTAYGNAVNGNLIPNSGTNSSSGNGAAPTPVTTPTAGAK